MAYGWEKERRKYDIRFMSANEIFDVASNRSRTNDSERSIRIGMSAQWEMGT